MVSNWTVTFYNENGNIVQTPIFVPTELYAKEVVVRGFAELSEPNQAAAVYVDAEATVTMYPLTDYMRDGSSSG